jgi:hypothetical protein
MPGRKDFHEECATRCDVPPRRIEWTDPNDCIRTIVPFVGHNNNHAHLPTGGGLDVLGVKASREASCLELVVARKVVNVVRPKRLILEHVSSSPHDSFLLLELEKLRPSGVYEQNDQQSEEVVDVSGEYVSRDSWDVDHLGYDESGNEIPLPNDAKLVVRYFGGKVLFVCKGSVWNGLPETYDGRHSTMTSDQIRQFIEDRL